MSETKVCGNCGAGLNARRHGFCSLCHFAIAGAELAGMTEGKALTLVRNIRADKRLEPMTRTFEKVLDDE